MSTIEDAIARKYQQLPQFDYMWRVELPELGREGFMDPFGVTALNCSPDVAEFVTGGFGGGALSTFASGVRRLANTVTTAVGNVTERFGFPNPLAGRSFESIGRSTSLKTERQTDMLNHRVFSIDTPYKSFEVTKHTFGQGFFYNAGTNEIGSMSMRIDEYEDGATLDYLLQWQKLIQNNDGTHNPPAAYKRDIRFIKMASSGIDLHVTVFRGCWPSEIANSSFSYDSSAISQISVTFSVDGVEHFIIPASQVISAVESVQGDILNGIDMGRSGDFTGIINTNNLKKNLTTAVVSEISRRVSKYFF